MLSTFENLQVPIKQSKLEGSDTCLTLLGIGIDTDQLQLHLPHKKLVDLKASLAAYMGHTSILKKEMERLTGLLQFACKVMRPGRPFLHQPSTASNSVSSFIKVLHLAMTSTYLTVHSLSNYVCMYVCM